MGSAGSVVSAVASLSANFTDLETQMRVSREAIASSITTTKRLLIDADDINNISPESTAAGAAFIGLKDILRDTSTTAEELREEFLLVVNSIGGIDMESGLTAAVLEIEGAIASYIDSLRQQEQALASATSSLDSQKQELFIELLEAQGKTAQALAIQRAREIEEPSRD